MLLGTTGTQQGYTKLGKLSGDCCSSEIQYNKEKFTKPDTRYMIHALVYLLCASVTVTLLKSLGK